MSIIADDGQCDGGGSGGAAGVTRPTGSPAGWRSPIKIIDTVSTCAGLAHAIQRAGYAGIMHYARLDRANALAVQQARSIGLKIGWCYETGNPTTPEYHCESQGFIDASRFLRDAQTLSIRPGETIFPAFDLDVPEGNAGDSWLHGPALDYQVAFHDRVKAEGFRVGAYGTWKLLAHLKEQGYLEFTWLCQSTGFAGYSEGKDLADIVQLLTPVAVVSGDENIVRNPGCLL